jgi:cyclopropane-fatty-acyl-phospholipid synthase
MFSFLRDENLLSSTKECLSYIATALKEPVTAILWDGSKVALGDVGASKLTITIAKKGVIASLLKKPTLENIMRHYAIGNILAEGADLIEFCQTVRDSIKKKELKQLGKSYIFKKLWPFLFVKATKTDLEHVYTKDETGMDDKQRNNQDFIQFHYDVSNDFYKLFLDPEMLYSCAYFKDWSNTLDQAQLDKLDMICRKLRLKSGDRMLDIGCGWGALVCFAAKNYGVTAHGITLSQAQYDYVTAKVKEMGLQDKVKVEIRDYITLDGEYDKISSIGMFEHIGLDKFPEYFKKVSSLLSPNGVFLNHGIARRAKANKKRARNITAEKRLILKYIFPGSELAPIGTTVEAMEAYGFEIHDVEGWREHYSLTCKHWCQRLSANKEAAVKAVGIEKYRMWVAYLAGVSFGFWGGSILLYQVVGTRRSKAKGSSNMPCTREDLYTTNAHK